MATWWLSFCKDEQLLGVVILDASDMSEAVSRAWEMNLHPGGKTEGAEMPTGMFHPDWLDRLLTKEEADALA